MLLADLRPAGEAGRGLALSPAGEAGPLAGGFFWGGLVLGGCFGGIFWICEGVEAEKFCGFEMAGWETGLVAGSEILTSQLPVH